MFHPLILSGAPRHLPLVTKGRLCVAADLGWLASGGTAFLHGQKSGEKRAAKEGCMGALAQAEAVRKRIFSRITSSIFPGMRQHTEKNVHRSAPKSLVFGCGAVLREEKAVCDKDEKRSYADA